MVRVIVIVLIYRGFNRAELGCYGQSYSDRVDIHVLTELNSGAMVNVYSDCIDIQVLTELNSGALVRVKVVVLIYMF
jgi:hypothetical protein